MSLDESKIVESEEVQPGLVVDYDDKGQVVGIELLGISALADQMELSSILFQIV